MTSIGNAQPDAARGGVPRFVAFLLVGVLNTAVGYLLFAALLAVGLHYAVAALVATILGVLFNFQTIGRLVFRSRDRSLVFRFFGVYAVTYVVNVGALRLVEPYGLDVLVVQAFLVLPMAGLSFFLNQRYVFTREVAGS